MAPIVERSAAFTEPFVRTAKAAVIAAGPNVARLASREVLSRRGLSVTSDSQKVTLGVIAAYIVAIAILWNLPFVRWSLWPFKVSRHHHSQRNDWGQRGFELEADHVYRCWSSRSMNSAMPSPPSAPEAALSPSRSTPARAASPTWSAARTWSRCPPATWAPRSSAPC